MSSAPGAAARLEYTRRLAERRASLEKLESRHNRLADIRLGVFAVGLALAGAAWAWDSVAAFWVVLPAVLFVALIVFHERTLRAKARAADAVRYYEQAMARLDHRWAGTGVQGNDLAPPDHPYAADLDLFGEGSLFELLCTCRTRAGEETLAHWLCTAPDTATIRERQQAVEELRDRLDLREDLALLGGAVRAGVRPALLTSWAAAPPALTSRWLRVASFILTVLALAGIMAWIAGGGPGFLVLVVVAETGFARIVRDPIRAVLGGVDAPARDLKVLAHVFSRLESDPFASVRLAALRHELGEGPAAASRAIAGLDRLITWMEAYRNMMFAPLAFALLWPVHFAYALEAWRACHGLHVARWLSAVGEMEALCALAAYAYEHEGDPFPEIVGGGPLYDGKELGHPLIPPGKNVRNDVSLGEGTRAFMVSGSNMSGKSTLLRTIGVNAVLAFAGAPVHAQSLRLSPLGIGATLRVQDSIQDGASRFYAEISKLRVVVDLAQGDRPLLFLLDEILSGTNSHDRGAGAEALLRGLVDAGAVGLVTTHDLALTKSAESFGGKVVNVHFEDHLEGDRLVFDYRMRPGVVTKSNALALMRAVGLKV